MARRAAKTEAAPDTRDAARKDLEDHAAAAGKLLDAQYDAKVSALDAHIAQVNEPFVGSSLTIKGNQGR